MEQLPVLMVLQVYYITTEVIQEIFNVSRLTPSQRTSLMVFADKPKKSNSRKVKDKRTLSLLNSDFKIATGIEAARHNKILEHTVSESQYAVGGRRIHHAINLARDAIFAAGKSGKGVGIADQDFEAAFNFLCMDWVERVLKKGYEPCSYKENKKIVHRRDHDSCG